MHGMLACWGSALHRTGRSPVAGEVRGVGLAEGLTRIGVD